MQNILKLAILATCIGVSVSATAKESGPFGTRMGMPKEELLETIRPQSGVDTRVAEFSVVTDAAISASKFFRRYIYFITPETGLCSVIGITKITELSSVARRDFSNIEAQLAKKYGEPSSRHHLITPHYGTENLFEAIAQGKRMLVSMWSRSDLMRSKGARTNPLPNDLDLIILEVAPQGQSGFVKLAYSYTNVERCSAIMKGSDGKGL